MNTRGKAVLLLLVLLSTLYARKRPTMDQFRKETEAFRYMERKKIGAERLDTNINMYCAYAYITLDAPFEKVAPYLLDFEGFDEVFDHIKDVHQIKNKCAPTKESYYIEGKALMVHAWGVGQIEKMTYHPDSLIDIEVRPICYSLFRKFYLEKKGKIKWHVKKVHLDAQLMKLDDKRCRVGVRGFSTTNKPVPTWMLSLLFHIVLPGLMDDLVDTVNENKPISKSRFTKNP